MNSLAREKTNRAVNTFVRLLELQFVTSALFLTTEGPREPASGYSTENHLRRPRTLREGRKCARGRTSEGPCGVMVQP